MFRKIYLALLLAAIFTLPEAASAQTCARTITADVVAFDQVFFWNRLGAVQPQGMMYALRRDVVPISGSTLSPGNVQLRPGKRPRPITLRMNVGDCLRVTFQNLLAPTRRDDNQSATRWASIHAVGMQWTSSSLDDGSYVGANPNGLVNVGQSIIYTTYADREGEHVLNSAGALAGGEGDGGQANSGLFGALIVEPPGARWYRSQVTRQDMDYAVTGTSAYGQPVINYEAAYPAGHPRAGTPVFNMLSGNEIIHTDLTAVITGSAISTTAGPGSSGWFPAGTFPNNPQYRQREQPFREFVFLYHDEVGAVQAFPEFEQPQLEFTLHSGRDGFAINYGSGGIGAEVLANRLRVGPMWNCTECMFEEFFLSSWTVGDPAMVVDVPANVPCGTRTNSPNTVGQDPNFPLYVDQLKHGAPCTPLPNAKATKAFFPDDPSNVYHGYLNDHTRHRVLHAGSKEHHIHHLHAHQWQFTADGDKSNYLDSQAIGPAASFTAEIAHGGGGNRNLTPGDSIFHCHFYPHFAQGMWGLWRVHDVFERGTLLDGNGRPVAGDNRALPDGEIAAGTPIPAVLPLPGKPMAPMPGATVAIVSGQAQVSGGGNPGYPFFVPALAGHRPPKPPLDTIDDGGLPRHRVTGGTFVEAHTRTDFHKTLLTMSADPLPENGTPIEQQAMAFHEQPLQNSCEPHGLCSLATRFPTNGRPRTAGAPIADPCIGPAASTPLVVKAADIQDDVKLNKAGWHFQQQRMTALWDDVDDFLGLVPGPRKPPEPLFFRANSDTCINYWFTNLMPMEYRLDDFQVLTPTDVVGQHIHLVKFDVLASDGAANGFNYEDGSFAPDEVVQRIDALRAFNGCSAGDARNGTFACPVPKPHPFFGSGPDRDGNGRGDWVGAQTTLQRWWADPVLDNAGNDRTLRTVFTHDHMSPSTHQQAGLYAGLVIEPKGSRWYHNETGQPLGGRHDGGPTSWQAVIDPLNEPDYREFMLEFGDFQLAYEPGGGFPDPARAVNPPGRREVGLPDLLRRPQACPGSNAAPPCPELLSAAEPGTMSVNYRNEPLALRVRDPLTNSQAAGQAGDLSYAFASIARADPALNGQPGFYQPLTADLDAYDPFTPMLRAYENDRVQVRVLVGAHEEGHNFSIHGVKWLFEPSEPNSGYRSSQMMGISEHYEFIIPQLVKNPNGSFADRLWSAGSSTDDFWNGLWGVLRAYNGTRQDLFPLPDNPDGRGPIDPSVAGAWDFSCPKTATVRNFDVSAVAASAALPNGRLIYNNRTDGSFGPLWDSTSILYVRSSDLDAAGKLRLNLANRPEPLILRALAGECIKLTLRNKLPATLNDLDGYNTLPMIVENFNANDIRPSSNVGLHPQLVYYDVSRFDGTMVGRNKDQLVKPGQFATYEWYAGDAFVNEDGTITATPIELGATNLISSDRIEHASKGAIGALIIEPKDGFINEYNPSRRAEATINGGSEGGFREFVLIYQNDVNMRTDQSLGRVCFPNDPIPGAGQGWPVENLGCEEDPEDSGQKAINYTTEPLWKRMQHPPGTPFEATDDFADWFDVLSNVKVGGNPQTPIFQAPPGTNVRFRLLMPGGHSRNIVFSLAGHQWDREPYINNSTQLGRNTFSFWEGAHMGHGPTNHFDVLLRNNAGGKFIIPGDYVHRDSVSQGLDAGLWGIFRVQ
ncbi:MAG TPA: copper oxidase [Thermoanaerobaculia bacterium]|nr:copper oxidase [Thermoanaerobaculia bacterium]